MMAVLKVILCKVLYEKVHKAEVNQIISACNNNDSNFFFNFEQLYNRVNAVWENVENFENMENENMENSFQPI